MEPLASIHPTRAAGTEGTARLSDGRVLVAEVLQRLSSDSVLIQVAGQKVPAETGVEFKPGDQFLVRVEQNGDELNLRMVENPKAQQDPALLEAVRYLMGDATTIGKRVGEVAAGLEGLDSEALRQALASRVFDPDGGEPGLRALLGSDQSAWPKALAAALAELGLDAGDRVKKLFAQLQAPFAALGIDPSPLEGNLAQILRSLVLEARPSPEMSVQLERFTAALAKALEHAGDKAGATTLRNAGGAALGSAEQALFRALLQTPSALGGKSELARVLTGESFARLDADLRGAIAAELAAETAKSNDWAETLKRALGGLDLEELLNSIRREAGEPVHLSMPVPDVDGWTTAHLYMMERESREKEGEEPQASYRVVLGVEFSKLGKVRADLLLRGDSLAARLRTDRPRTAMELRASKTELTELLAGEGRKVTLTILDGTREEVSVDRLTHDVRYLRDHHLMDVKG